MRDEARAKRATESVGVFQLPGHAYSTLLLSEGLFRPSETE